MIHFAWLLGVTYGLTFFLCSSKLFRPVRSWLVDKSADKRLQLAKDDPFEAEAMIGWDDLFACYFCTGFWASLVVLSLDRLLPPGGPPTVSDLPITVMSALALATATYITDIVVRYLERLASSQH